MSQSFHVTPLRALVVVVACSTQACASARDRLQSGVASAVTGTVVQSNAEAQVTMPVVRTLHVSYGPSAMPVLGLFGIAGIAAAAAIDAHQAEMLGARPASAPEKSAEELTRILRAQTSDVDFGALYERALQGALSKIGWLRLHDVEREAPARPVLRDQAAFGRSLLHVVTTQRISGDGRLLLVQSALAFHAKGASDGPSAQVQIKYRSEEIGAESPTNAVTLWAKNHGSAYRKALDESVVENMKMTTMALAHMAGTTFSGRVDMLKVHMDSESADAEAQQPPLEIAGTIVEESEHRLILEAEWLGSLWFLSLPKDAIEARFSRGLARGFAWRAPPPPARATVPEAPVASAERPAVLAPTE